MSYEEWLKARQEFYQPQPNIVLVVNNERNPKKDIPPQGPS